MTSDSNEWFFVDTIDALDEDDFMRFDHRGETYILYKVKGELFATDGLCTHEAQHLEDGVLIGHIIECPLHQGRFDIRNGKCAGGPVCEHLKTYRVKVEADRLFIELRAG